jgi:N-glycosylase/DNA lyase
MNGELILEVDCFNLKYTLECGQCFRWKEINKNEYVGVIKDRVVKIKQVDNKLIIKSNNNENLEDVIKKYFDLDVYYKVIENKISKIDDNVKKAVKNTTGIRILNQDFFETLLSYIISANNNIPRISKSVNLISEKYGKKIIFENDEYYLFPAPEDLKKVTEEEFKKCGVGFRARYLKHVVEDILNNKLDIKEIENTSTAELKKKLLTIMGVGPKVADCILLFSCKRYDVFPIDVWVERVMTNLYFKEYGRSMKKKEILEYADKHFGKEAGIVQQHLFYNVREGLI